MARILVIDDDDVCTKLTKLKLTSAGFEVTCHRGPFGSLNAIRRGEYDVILLDIMMPALDGRGVMRLIRSTPGLEQTRIVFHSSLDLDVLDQLTKDYGAHGYISKSCSSEALAAMIAKVVKDSSRS
jgi:CheY-like chemotaxis protein